ncbi:UvrD-helicase domain-containing protein, partial [Patescibacteria group bacterium]|nr:UvrD-helicase domain-containing protein [Patescibacteria group bacterium]
MHHILQNLNEKQKEAVLAIEGPVLIIAGAGSGKTKALTHRVAYLIANGIAPETILAVTFTNKAAQEMAVRVRALTASRQPATNNAPFIGTFHAFCVRVLREEAPKIGFTKQFSIFDDDDSLSLVKEVIKELNLNPKQYPAGLMAHAVSSLKSELVTPDEYEGKDASEIFPKTLYAVYDRYQKSLKRANAFDFDDLILNAVMLFRQYPETLARWQNKFRHIHVDEYQDTNAAQYELIKLLAKKHGNIFVIGDDAQSIYGFRHADFRNMLN